MQPIEPGQSVSPDSLPDNSFPDDLVSSDLIPSGLEPQSVQFVPLAKFRGRRYGYLLHNKVYVCPVLHAYLTDPQHRHQALARLPILDVEAYFSEAASQRMKADIAAATQWSSNEDSSRGGNK